MNITFQNKTILVVGAAFDIGQGIAKAFATTGAKVYACDIIEETLKHLEGSCGEGRIRTGPVDVTDEASVRHAVRAADTGDGIDVLVYVAGGVAGQVKTPLEEVTVDSFRRILDINVTGLFLFAREIVPLMKQKGRGRIVSISSRAGQAPSLTGVQAYCAAKHAQNGLVRQLAFDLVKSNITVNAVAPGFLRSSPATRAQWDSYTPEFQQSFMSSLLGGRLGKPDDIAAATLFLASDQAEWISGQIIPVMGGLT